MNAALVKQGFLPSYEPSMTPSMPPSITRCASSPGPSRTLQVAVVFWHVAVLKDLSYALPHTPPPPSPDHVPAKTIVSSYYWWARPETSPGLPNENYRQGQKEGFTISIILIPGAPRG
jgi:hypothetical protein